MPDPGDTLDWHGDVQDDIHNFARERGVGDGEPWTDGAISTVRRWVKDAAGNVCNGSDDDRWRHVPSRDLRRSWATYHLVERQVDVQTMMAVGGWSDHSAIEPSLKERTESRIGEAFDERRSRGPCCRRRRGYVTATARAMPWGGADTGSDA